MSSGNNGRILGTIVGAVVGYFTAGVGWGLGAAIGGYAGGLLDPKPKTEGPRLDDLKVQQSQYGVGIPTLYGTERVSGNIIWSTDKIEIANTQSQGKGGGAENTSYKYYVHMRLLMTETPADGDEIAIVKIFQDGKLIWDMSSGIPIGSALASEENLYASFILYQGKADQMPNPEEEAWLGAGNVPAYRGVVSMYMRAIECVAGRVPQFSFVLSKNAAVGPEITLMVDLPTSGDTLASGGGVIRSDGVTHFSTDSGSGLFSTRYWFASSGALTPMGMLAPYPGGGYYPYPVGGATPSPWTLDTALDGKTYLSDLSAGGRSLWLDYGAAHPGDGDDTPGASGYGRAYYDAVDDALVLSSYAPSGASPAGTTWIVSRLGGTPIPVASVPAGNGKGPVVAYFQGVVYLVVVPAGGVGAALVRRTSTGAIDPLMPDTIDLSVNFDGKWSALYVDAGGVYLYCVEATGGDAAIYKIRPASLVDPVGDFREMIGFGQGLPGAGSIFNATSRTFYASDSLAIIGPFYGGDYLGYVAVRFNAVTENDALVSDIIAEQCMRVGESRYDVSAIPDSAVVRGYKIAGPASARANIDPLMSAFDIFIVDEDGLIKFKMRADIESVGTVTFDELGQVESLGQFEAPLPLTRTQAIDFPRSLTVSYIEPDFDYQQASETSVRVVTEATEDQGIALPVALKSSDQAMTAATRMHYAAWNAQNGRSSKISRKFAYISPGDGLTYEYPRGSFKLKRIGALNDTGLILESVLEPGDAAIFEQTATGATGYVPQQVPPLAPPTRMVLLDAPILRDQDNEAGKYGAFAPLGETGWRGASVLVSDDGLNFEDKGAVSPPGAVIGFAETVLAAGPFFGIDHANTLTVDVGNGELNTVGWDDIFSAGRANLAALTSFFEVDGFPDAVVEYFQFRVATDLGSGRYRLSELVRGLYGTERVAFNHSINDTFVLMDPAQGLLRIPLEAGDIGSDKYYKAVSFGRNPDNVASTTSETIGYGLKPLSPVNVKLDRTPTDGSVAFTWGRRTRFAHNALQSIMPLGEEAQAFDVVIYSDSSYSVVVNVYRVYSPAFTYTAAQLAADGKTQLGTIPYRLYQISGTVGRGIPFQPGQGLS